MVHTEARLKTDETVSEVTHGTCEHVISGDVVLWVVLKQTNKQEKQTTNKQHQSQISKNKYFELKKLKLHASNSAHICHAI